MRSVAVRLVRGMIWFFATTCKMGRIQENAKKIFDLVEAGKADDAVLLCATIGYWGWQKRIFVDEIAKVFGYSVEKFKR